MALTRPRDVGALHTPCVLSNTTMFVQGNPGERAGSSKAAGGTPVLADFADGNLLGCSHVWTDSP